MTSQIIQVGTVLVFVDLRADKPIRVNSVGTLQ